MLLSGLAFKYKYGGCNATYYSNTKRYFKVQICEHLGISQQQPDDNLRTPAMLQSLSIL